MLNFESKEHYTISDLERLIRLLRGPGGCPWDREQPHESIRRNFLEEAYEAVEAIDEKDPAHLCEELGDVLMQVVFHAGIEEDAGGFTLDDVADMTCRKLLNRHPHVFGEQTAGSAAEVLVKWDEIKRAERGQTTVGSAMDTVARSLPALWRADKLQGKARKAGFDWPDVAGALSKLEEETAELRRAGGGDGDVAEELGDVLFSAVNVSRFLDIDPEAALSAASDKFIARFRRVERAAADSGRALRDISPDELDKLWEAAKHA
jgi:tetrapyrrole methylase family protein/MazG family protein